uniref:Activin_recp domain-containing protein n=1 Tax=Steinernema glaseri TaxID=37863 RepID=A0A1I8AR88_9BILA
MVFTFRIILFIATIHFAASLKCYRGHWNKQVGNVPPRYDLAECDKSESVCLIQKDYNKHIVRFMCFKNGDIKNYCKQSKVEIRTTKFDMDLFCCNTYDGCNQSIHRVEAGPVEEASGAALVCHPSLLLFLVISIAASAL